MKKIIYALLATLSGLVLLLSYRTSLEAIGPIAIADPASSSDTTSTLPTRTDGGAIESFDDDDDEWSDDEDDDDRDDEETPVGSSGSVSPNGSSSDASSGTTSSPTSSFVDGTYMGGAANTRYGPVQVQMTVSGGQIADVKVIDYPHSDRRDKQINEYALPILVSETTQAQSSRVDMVSGATYTSQGYVASLQSAIDQAQS